MALLSGTIFITADPIDAGLLEEAISHAFAYRRDHGKRIHPADPLFVLQSQLHMVASTVAETTAVRHAEQPATTPTPLRRDASATMSVMEVSEMLGVSAQAVTKACRERRLHAAKVRGKWRITRTSVLNARSSAA